MYNLSTSFFGCNASSLFSLFSCPGLSIHSLSTVVFLLRIWMQPLPRHLLLLFCFSHLVFILGPIEAFAFIFIYCFFFHFIFFHLILFLTSFTFRELYFFTSNYFLSLFMVRNPNFFFPNSIPLFVLNTWTVLFSVTTCSSLLKNSFKSSMNKKWFSLYSFFPIHRLRLPSKYQR